MDAQIGADAHLGPKVSIHLGSGEGQVDVVWVFGTVDGRRWIVQARRERESEWWWMKVGEVGGCVCVCVCMYRYCIVLPSHYPRSRRHFSFRLDLPVCLEMRRILPVCLSVLIPSAISSTLASFTLCLPPSAGLSSWSLPLPRPCLILFVTCQFTGFYSTPGHAYETRK